MKPDTFSGNMFRSRMLLFAQENSTNIATSLFAYLFDVPVASRAFERKAQERNHLKELDADGRVILHRILKE